MEAKHTPKAFRIISPDGDQVELVRADLVDLALEQYNARRELDIIPMPSARKGPGTYEVIGTSHGVDVIHWQRGKWLLQVDGGRYIGPFRTKRDALVYCQEHPEL